MLPTRNIMDDCDFRDAYDIPTTVNFIMALGKATEFVNVDAVKKFTYRNIFSIKSCWYKEIPQQQNSEDSMGGCIIDGDLDNLDHIFRS